MGLGLIPELVVLPLLMPLVVLLLLTSQALTSQVAVAAVLATAARVAAGMKLRQVVVAVLVAVSAALGKKTVPEQTAVQVELLGNQAVTVNLRTIITTVTAVVQVAALQT
jgi:Na+-transporting NADH:ubiquinone oxidoreductase subunit NqrF